MSIDWSKAPEGCIGAFARIISKTAFFVFSKRPSDYMSREGYEGEGEDGPYHVFSEYWEWIDKPWDGQGLPPIGTVCEYRHMIWPEYRPCEIRYISEESLVAYDDAQEQFYRTCDMLFRPIRTPEQIAAEEREKAVGDMAMSIQGVPYQYPTLYALYDAGYRRQESST
ncbi:hypothetical protein [Pseudomonas aeruginosa]|uniref:hypothetical protein n=1 Tax=Pseudomonas aeruginosa TaxID=287 RepID=UPI000665A6D4|nr:hypothetical protein [Pseudomonas aeruginosa]MBI7214752.1 hypothetical protein [Pseudomonas aeruginosa]MBI8055617.1 hypothetical protein [Pseudomonas aeruginosa]MBI8506534.1 hypothetical protein [Pseudomonas aeruginosa]MBV5623247.1 hypothetical protein [Pseudomonas aeruginosa]MBZ3687399.1 hypothetical protein [Pseudomonas aeruginosa]